MLVNFEEDIIPPNDEQRLSALRRLKILNTAPEAAFDNITQIVAQVFDAPMSFISLVDKDQVFYKSQVGPFGRDAVLRQDSLCSYTILNKEVLVIEDASIEACFHDNPYVAAQGGLRFYAGAPLITKDGYQIGTVCIVDTKPRTFSEDNKSLLMRFAQMVMHDIELRYVSILNMDAEVAIKESEQRFQNLVRDAQVGIILLVGDQMKVEVVNESYARLIGRTADELYRKNLFDIIPEAEAAFRPIIDGVRKSGEPFYLYGAPYKVLVDEKPIEGFLNLVYQPYHEVDGKVSGVMVLCQDVTEQVQSRKKIEESQQRFLSLANSINQLAWIADDKGWIYWYNERWFAYTGTTLEEMEGWGWEKVHHPDHKERVVSFVKEAWQRDESWELVFPLRRHDGEYRWFLTRGVPVHNNEGQIIQWIGTNTDIENQKQAEELLEQRVQERTKELELRNRELEQFTHVSHHDLQEPLRKIAIFTDMVKGDAEQKLSEASQMRLQKVSDAAYRMSMALRDVLDFASLSKAEQFVKVDLEEVLAGVQGDLELFINEKKAAIISDALPVIKGIPTQMHQLLYNLINNTLKFSKPNQAPRISITCARLLALDILEHQQLDQSKSYYFIAVQDNGIGFRQEHAEKIFDMFQRLHSKKEYGGTGIGLALVKKVVINHGGIIWAEGKEGESATFKILLPAT